MRKARISVVTAAVLGVAGISLSMAGGVTRYPGIMCVSLSEEPSYGLVALQNRHGNVMNASCPVIRYGSAQEERGCIVVWVNDQHDADAITCSAKTFDLATGHFEASDRKSTGARATGRATLRLPFLNAKNRWVTLECSLPASMPGARPSALAGYSTVFGNEAAACVLPIPGQRSEDHPRPSSEEQPETQRIPPGHLQGVGDFDGDGTADLVWLGADNQVHYWRIRGGQRVGGGTIQRPGGSESAWVLQGAGDVDGDGTADLVWRRNDGQVQYWRVKEGNRVRAGNIHRPGENADRWSLLGVGDVDGDGTADLVWRRDDGQVHYWKMKNGERLGGSHVHRPGENASRWSLECAGDVDGDGTADLIWRRDDGQVHYWKMRGGRRVSGRNVNHPPEDSGDWSLAGAGDVDGDGTADLIWQRDDGGVHYWKMKNGQRVESGEIR